MKIWRYVFVVLILIFALLIIAIFQIPDGNLHVITCDVGQGDAILAIYENFQILTDGGPPNGKVVDCLSKYLPFWDRELEVVVNTHPQLDHFGGLIEVFEKYKVDNFVANGLDASTPEYKVLKSLVGGSGAKVINPTSGMVIGYDLISYDIFWPQQQFLDENGAGEVSTGLGTFDSKLDPNSFSVQAVLSLGRFKALLTGDIGSDIAGQVLPNLSIGHLDYIKIPHHGSRYGATQNYLNAFEPKVAVISVGKNNTYGHPAPEILKILEVNKVEIFRTDEIGNVELISNGDKFWKGK